MSHVDTPKLKVLIADDASVMRMLLKTMLQRLVRCQVVEAKDGPNAIKSAQDEQFDLVFLDVNMPHINGLTVLDALRKSQEYRTTPIVLLTALGQEKYRERGMALGATAYMLKPLREMELVRVVQKVMAPHLMGGGRRDGDGHG
jgi:two-component system chemotaxis response regulator CheY